MVLLIGVRYSVSISGAARRCSAFRLNAFAALFFLKEMTASRTSFLVISIGGVARDEFNIYISYILSLSCGILYWVAVASHS